MRLGEKIQQQSRPSVMDDVKGALRRADKWLDNHNSQRTPLSRVMNVIASPYVAFPAVAIVCGIVGNGVFYETFDKGYAPKLQTTFNACHESGDKPTVKTWTVGGRVKQVTCGDKTVNFDLLESGPGKR
jgi:hypothetical protein